MCDTSTTYLEDPLHGTSPEVYRILYGDLPAGVSSSTDTERLVTADVGDDAHDSTADETSRSDASDVIEGGSLGLTASCVDSFRDAGADESLVYSQSSLHPSDSRDPSTVGFDGVADVMSMASSLTHARRQRRRMK